jgi:hypothetical protein
MAIIKDEDNDHVSKKLTDEKFRVTFVASTEVSFGVGAVPSSSVWMMTVLRELSKLSRKTLPSQKYARKTSDCICSGCGRVQPALIL